MNWVALRMLTGDRSKYLGLIFGVGFATLLMSQQVSLLIRVHGIWLWLRRLPLRPRPVHVPQEGV